VFGVRLGHDFTVERDINPGLNTNSIIPTPPSKVIRPFGKACTSPLKQVQTAGASSTVCYKYPGTEPTNKV
jgi:hypothetical protein